MKSRSISSALHCFLCIALSVEPRIDNSVRIDIEMNKERDAGVEEKPADAGVGASTTLHPFNLYIQSVIRCSSFGACLL
jgi:hypothetical protein